MEKAFTSSNIESVINKLNEKSKQNKGLEYRQLYMRVSYAAARDKFISEIGAKAFGVFIVVFCFSDKVGIAYPSLQTIASLSGCSVTAVQKELGTLLFYRWIKKVGRIKTAQGRFGNTKYQILETDLIRTSQQPNFIDSPSVKYTNGV